jgi:hypothetical protein
MLSGINQISNQCGISASAQTPQTGKSNRKHAERPPGTGTVNFTSRRLSSMGIPFMSALILRIRKHDHIKRGRIPFVENKQHSPKGFRSLQLAGSRACCLLSVSYPFRLHRSSFTSLSNVHFRTNQTTPSNCIVLHFNCIRGTSREKI